MSRQQAEMLPLGCEGAWAADQCLEPGSPAGTALSSHPTFTPVDALLGSWGHHSRRGGITEKPASSFFFT